MKCFTREPADLSARRIVPGHSEGASQPGEKQSALRYPGCSAASEGGGEAARLIRWINRSPENVAVLVRGRFGWRKSRTSEAALHAASHPGQRNPSAVSPLADRAFLNFNRAVSRYRLRDWGNV